MERFAFKIDSALRANLYKICRLCGIDNPSKVPILLPKDSAVVDLDEPTLSQKVFELIGFTVTQNDKMPQTMCSLCVDKINDFYEFREMCFATNKQTRSLLGLKQADAKKVMDVKPILKNEPLPIVSPGGNRRGRKRKTEENLNVAASGSSSNALELSLETIKNEPCHWRKKQRLQHQLQQQLLEASKNEIKEEPTEDNKLFKKCRKASCNVCGERFKNKELAEEHKSYVHVPSILRYICNACNQSHNSPSDIKAHQLWHKLSKTPYMCPLCDASVANNYAFTRHLRVHTSPTPIELLVLDRECPLCKKTFLTNFFYNTHPCARRTRKCGGCNRALNSDMAYMKHAPHCPKIYLNHSKHIMPEASHHESQMRIKNEYDVELEENVQAPDATVPYIAPSAEEKEMQPVVILERLKSPLLRTTEQPNTLGRNNDRVSTKSYLKRVDQLLKNTMNTLVSIKHEPEVHIDDTGPLAGIAEQPESEPDDEPPACDDFHADNDDSDEDAASCSGTAAIDVPAVVVKQEIIDDTYDKPQMGSSDGVQIKQEPLKLKLKITNNHGQLNSSIVDDDQEMQVQSKSSKKKKKRKHKERNKESTATATETETPTDPTEPLDSQIAAEQTTEQPTTSSAMISIKQENPDDNYPNPDYEPQATVMTTIPMLQLDSSYNNETNQEVNTSSTHQEPEDVKPNRLELDRLMQITHIASGVVMAEEPMPPERAVEAVVPKQSHEEIKPKIPKYIRIKSTARKSTGGGPRDVPSSSGREPAVSAQGPLPQIVSVESGAAVPFNIMNIKPEPLNRGYADEQEVGPSKAVAAERSVDGTNEINQIEKRDEETAYINSLDLNNVTIKQEKDLHISDVNINGSEADNIHYNGHESEGSGKDDVDDSASSADEAEENMDTHEEERIYREIELPPLEEQSPVKTTSQAESKLVEAESAPSSTDPNLAITQSNSAMPQVEPQPFVEPQAEHAPEDVVPESNAKLVDSKNQCELPQAKSLQVAQELTPTALAKSQEVEPREGTQEQAKSEVPQLGQKTPSKEIHQEIASGSNFNIVITSVCSQAERPLPPKNKAKTYTQEMPKMESLGKSTNNEENVTCPVVTLSAPKDNETLAQPFFTVPSSSSTNYNCDEEQQNVLNHELFATEQQREEAVEQVVEPEAGTSVASCQMLIGGSDGPSANEETENRINEQQLQVQQEQEQLQQRCEINDDSNINEIAENNNNANIERELNDDANVAQENPNI